MKVEPCWIFVEDRLLHVSTFAHLLPSQRPLAFCPLCKEQVTLKLGIKNAHHYAHRPEIICSVTRPETALHFNTKFHIYNELLKGSQISIQQPCSKYCNRYNSKIWLTDWDSVEVEFSIGSARPDIAIIKENKVIGAIEVLFSHAIDTHKANYYANNNISWIEVRADEEIYSDPSMWEVDEPIPYLRTSFLTSNWTCPSCTNHQRQRETQAEYERNNHDQIHAAKMVDFYFPSGKKFREVYFVVRRYRSGKCVETRLKTEKGQIIAVEKGDITEELLQKLKIALKLYLQQMFQRGAIIDENLKWRKWEKGQKFIARDINRFPFRYVWDREKGQWKSLW